MDTDGVCAGLAGLIEDLIAIPEHSDAELIAALHGDWFCPGWHLRLARSLASPTRLTMEWTTGSHFQIHFGPACTLAGRLVGNQSIEWADGSSWYKDSPLYARERRVFSQNGEDGVLLALLDALGVQRARALEFGVQDGRECNTRVLLERGDQVLQWDRDFDNPARGLHKELVTIDNIPTLVERYDVPRDIDVLSIDVDYYDFYFWWRMSQYVSPRIVIIELNSSWTPSEDRVVLYKGHKKSWDGTRYYGASLLALSKLAQRLGYTLIYCEVMGVNAFFVRNDELDKVRALVPNAGDLPRLYRRPRYGDSGHPPDSLDRPFTTAAALLCSPYAIWDIAG